MEILLLIIAGAVIYYLYITLQDYLKNPLETREKSSKWEYSVAQDPYVMQEQKIDPVEKSLNTEIGVLVGICAQLPSRGKNEIAYKLILEKFIANYLHSKGMDSKEQDKIIELLNEKLPNVMDLSKRFLAMSYAEYKKRLNFVEFLLMLVYLDGKIDDEEKEYLLDVAANLELDNDDFNALYESYEQKFEALENEEIVKEDEENPNQDEVLKSKIEEIEIDIFGAKNPAILEAGLKVRRICRALS